MPTIPPILRAVFLLLFSATFGFAAPSITSINPASGPTAGNTTITISGSGFGTTANLAFASLGGSSMTITSISDTQIRATTPAGEGTGKQVTVTVAGQTSNAATFSYLPPAISSFTPATFPTSGGTSLTLVGSNFGLNPMVTSGTTNFPVTSRTHTSIVCTVPAGQGSSVPVTVTTAGQTSNPVSISYSPPAITAITPATGATAGGSLITLTGSNFGLSPMVVFNGVTILPNSFSHTQAVFQLPAGEGTDIPVSLTADSQTSNTTTFSYGAPSIISINPASGPTQGGSVITIIGANFGLSGTASIGGVAAPVTPGGMSHNQMVVTLPAGQGAGKPVVVSVLGRTSNAVNFDYLPPSISGITYTSAPTSGGTILTINGANFGLSGTVSIGGQGASITAGGYSHNTITCTLPAGQGANLPVVVTSAGRSSNSVAFSYDPPAITGISPSAGPTSGGTLITLTGSNFGLSGTVFIGGQIATITAGGYSHTTITCTLPAGQGANLPVVVSSAGRATNSVPFSYNPPAITGISPSTGPTAGGTLITLTGSNFGTAPSLTMDGTGVSIQSSTHNEVVFALPAGQGTNKAVRLNAGGQQSAAVFFNYNAPQITGITADSYPTSGGITLTLTGSNFGISPTVSFGSGGATIIGTPTHTRILCTLPPGQGTNHAVTVTAGGVSSNTVLVDYDAPEILSITPSSAGTSGSTLITINGKNFGLSGTVSVGGQGATITAGGYSHTTITCTLPAGQGANLPVVVTSAGRSSNSVAFSYDPPAITGISTSAGPTAGGTLITLTGSNFGTSGTVSIGGQDAAVTSGGYSHTTITCTLPAGQGANLPVVVTSANRSSNSVPFSYNPPAITGISPATGPTAGGSLITLTGSNFGTSPVVLFNGESVTPNTSSHIELVFQLPAGEGNNLPVAVSAGDQVSSATSFSYGAPALTGISAAAYPTAGGTTLTLTGSNFGLNPIVKVGSSVAPLAPAGSSHTQIVCTLPAGQGIGKSVTVTVAETESNALNLDYGAPVITGITPASAGTAGGTAITINGNNFGLTNRSVIIGGHPITQLSSASHTQIICTLPAGQGANVPVQVSVDGRLSAASGFAYQPPVLSSLTPSSGPTSGGIRLTLTGSNFGVAPAVSIGGRAVQLAVSSHTLLEFDLPAGEGADQPVVVTAGDQNSAALPFDYEAPVITGITATSYPTSGGTVITLTGSNFGLNKVVTVGGQAATVQPGSTHTEVLCTLPPGQGTNVPVVLTAGEQASPAAFINYNAPAITSISPGNGPTSGSIPITINGTDFGLTPQVSIGGKPAAGISSTHTSIVCMLPAGGGLDQPVVVNAAGQVSNTVPFDYDGDTFSSWSESIAWNGLDSSPDADPRHTGWKNLLAYALGVDPTTTTGGEIASRNPPVRGMPAVTRGPTGALQVSFWRRRGTSSPDLVYQVQFSDNPGAAPWDAPAADPQIEVVDATWEFCTFTDASAGASRRFGRLKVELAPPP